MHRITYVQADWLCPCPMLPALPQLMQQFWFFQTKILLLLSRVVFFNCANNAKSFSSVFTATLKGQARWRCPNSVEQSVLQAKSEEKFCNHKSGGLENFARPFARAVPINCQRRSGRERGSKKRKRRKWGTESSQSMTAPQVA